MSGTQYSEKFRARMVEKMAGPQPMTALALAAETGVCQPTLSRWLREATTLRKKMAKRQDDEQQKLVAADAPQRTAEEKFSLVLEAAAVPETELGEWLRHKGVYMAQLDEWRAQAMARTQRCREAEQRDGLRCSPDPRARARARAQGQGARRGRRIARAPKKSSSYLGGRGRPTPTRRTTNDRRVHRRGRRGGGMPDESVRGHRSACAHAAALGAQIR